MWNICLSMKLPSVSIGAFALDKIKITYDTMKS